MAQVPYVALWGDGHTELGDVGALTLDDTTAVALSRGRFPKPYPHLDPNEDAALAAAGPGGRLIAVADGHNGFDAARAALEAVVARLPTLVAAETDPETALLEAFAAASAAVRSALRDADGPRLGSRTALSLVLVDASAIWTATAGDTSVVRIRGERAKVLSGSGAFLGPGTPPPPVESAKRKDGDRIVAMTDGVTDYLGTDWGDRLAGAVAAAPTALAGAAAVLDLALLGGAGDHVAVAAAWPRPAAS